MDFKCNRRLESVFFLRLVTLGCLTKVISDEGFRLTRVVTIFLVIPFLREGAYSWLTKPAALKNAADTEAQCGCEHGNSPRACSSRLAISCHSVNCSKGRLQNRPIKIIVFHGEILVMNIVNERTDSFAEPWLIYFSVPHCVTLRTENAHYCAYKLVF